MKSTLIYSAIIFAVFIGIASATSPFTMNIVSNTLYQNTNSTSLAIYAITHSAALNGYLGNSTSLTKVISMGDYNMSAYMLVEPNEYYKFNFTNATFIGQYLPKSSSSLAIIPQEVVSVSSINLYALLPFAVGLILGLLGAIMPWGWYRKSPFLLAFFPISTNTTAKIANNTAMSA